MTQRPPALDYASASRPHRFSAGFSFGIFLAVLANLAPYLWTYRAYQSDGYERMGFPFAFVIQGGIAYSYVFNRTALVEDLLIGFAFAALVGIVWKSVCSAAWRAGAIKR